LGELFLEEGLRKTKRREIKKRERGESLMKCKFCGRETEHEEEDICKKCLAEKLGREIEKHPIPN